MAQTTTSVNACNVDIQLDDSTGSLTNISGSTNQASIDMTAQSAETFTFEGQWAIQKVCKTSATISLQALYSTADVEALNILADWYFNSITTARTAQISVPDSTGGSDQYSGEWNLTSLNIPLSADDAGVILVSASLVNSGAVTRSTIAS